MLFPCGQTAFQPWKRRSHASPLEMTPALLYRGSVADTNPGIFQRGPNPRGSERRKSLSGVPKYSSNREFRDGVPWKLKQISDYKCKHFLILLYKS